MRQTAFDGAAGRDHRLADHLPAEHALPAGLGAVAAKKIHLNRFEVENGNEIDQALGHCLSFNTEAAVNFEGRASAHFPKFVLRLSTHLSRTSESYGHQQIYDSGAAFLFEVPEQDSPLVVQELQIGGTRFPAEPKEEKTGGQDGAQ